MKRLCAEAVITPRTVHFYIQAGLIPPAGTPGPGARYNEGHLTRLRLIKLLQKEHQPLAEIRRRLESLDDAEVGTILGEYRSQPTSSDSAVDYIRSVISGARHRRPRPVHDEETLEATSSPAPQRVTDRAQWERITLATDIELHIRRPLSRQKNRQVEHLTQVAREILKEEST